MRTLHMDTGGAGTMTRKRGDDQYGYDPERSVARSSLDCLERQAEQRPDKPTRKLGDVLKVPKVKPVECRLLDAHGEIMNGSPMEIVYQHSVLAQTSMPYKPTAARVWERSQGSVSLLIEAGRARHPDTGKWVELPLPHGEKPRLVLMHLNAEALRTGSPIIDVEGSMTAFVRSLGIHVNGRNIRTLRDQLARLAAAHIMLGVGPDTTKADIIRQFRVWWPDDAQQRVLWPSVVRLDTDYFNSLTSMPSRSTAGPLPRWRTRPSTSTSMPGLPSACTVSPRASRRRSHGRHSRRSSARTMTGSGSSGRGSRRR
jgi:hypothetical protein